MWQNPEKLGKKQTKERTVDTFLFYPIFKKNPDEEHFVIPKVKEN